MHPRQVVDGLLGQHRVAGPVALQPIENQDVGPLVARVAEVVRVVEAKFLAHREQQFSGVVATSAASATSVRPIRTPATG